MPSILDVLSERNFRKDRDGQGGENSHDWKKRKQKGYGFPQAPTCFAPSMQEQGGDAGLSETLHTAGAVSAAARTLLMAFGMVCTDVLLKTMGTPEDVFPGAHGYLRNYFVGVDATLLYNFGAAVLRAVGDTKRPLYFLTLSGTMNVCLNLFL